MMSRRMLVGGGILLLVLINVVILAGRFFKRDLPISEADSRLTKQQKHLMEWRSQARTSLMSGDIGDLDLFGAAADCMELPEGTSPVESDEIGHEQREDLKLALTGLFRAYAEDTPESLVAYMNDRGEQLDTVTVDFMRQMLTEQLGVAAAELQPLSPADIFARFWREAKMRSHWGAILNDSPCVQFWQSSSLGAAKAPMQGTADVGTWNGQATYRHNFVPKRNIQDAFQENNHVMMADVRVIIETDEELFRAPVPYYFRFWLSPFDGRWHPYLMQQVKTPMDWPERMLF